MRIALPLHLFPFSTRVLMVGLFTALSFGLLSTMSLGVYLYFHNSWYSVQVSRLVNEVSVLADEPKIPFDDLAAQNLAVREVSMYGVERGARGIFSQFKPGLKQSTEIVSQEFGEEYLVVSRFVAERGWIQLARNVTLSIENDHRLMLILLVAVFLGTTLSMATGYLFAEHILHSIKAITTAAHEISFQQLFKRVPVPARGENDELTELANTFNEMLARLQNSAENLQQFIGNASHELKTPLAVIQSSLQLLTRKLGSSSPQIEMMEEQIREMLSMIESLLILAREEELEEKKLTPMVPIIEQSISLYQKTIEEKRITLRKELESISVLTSEKQFSRVSDNLIGNAIKHAPEGETVTIVLNPKLFSVKNTGTEIAKADIDNLFQRFWRSPEARQSRKGSGLGLSITKRICDLHNWSIEVKSKKNETIFIVHFDAPKKRIG